MFVKNVKWLGGSYTGEALQKYPHGPGAFDTGTGSFFYGYFHEGLVHGPGVFYYQDGTADSGNFKGSVLDMPILAAKGIGFRWNATRTRASKLFEGEEVEEIPLLDTHRISMNVGLPIPSIRVKHLSRAKIDQDDFKHLKCLTINPKLSFDQFIEYISCPTENCTM